MFCSDFSGLDEWTLGRRKRRFAQLGAALLRENRPERKHQSSEGPQGHIVTCEPRNTTASPFQTHSDFEDQAAAERGMKRGTFHLLGTRRNPSLYDTDVAIKEREDVVLDLGSAAVPESGTAQVKPRPTVKRHVGPGPSSDDLYGFAVPTPKVPLLPPTVKVYAYVSANGSVLSGGNSTPVKFGGKRGVSPHPPMEPPAPPPSQIILPGPANFPPAAPAPPSWKLPSPKLRSPLVKNPDLAPLLAPQTFLADPLHRRASESHSFMEPHSPASSKHHSVAPFSLPDPSMGQSLPTGARIQKVPPPKQNRLCSLSSQDGTVQLQSPVPSPGDAAPASFNPQNKAKLYNMPKSSLLDLQKNGEPKLKPILLLEDSPLDPFAAQANNEAPTPAKGPGLAAMQATKQAQSHAADSQLQKNLPRVPRDSLMPTTPNETPESRQTPVRDYASSVTSGNSSGAVHLVPERSYKPVETGPKKSHIMNQTDKSRRLNSAQKPYYYNREVQATGLKERTTSPMSLLLAAKEREKHKTFSASDKSPKTNAVGEASFLSVAQNGTSHLQAYTMVSTADCVGEAAGHREKKNTQRSTLSPAPMAEEDPLDFIPPPPEFANMGEDVEEDTAQYDPPPRLPPPAPPSLKMPPLPPLLTPTPEAKTAMSSASPNVSKQASAVASLSSSQKTLQSVLEKKKLEMEQRHSTGPDNWAQSKSVKDSSASVGQRPSPAKENSSNPRLLPSQAHSLVLSELESRMSKMEPNAAKSTEPPTKQPHGMTFRVQPRAKQPITVIRKGDPS
ncbi:uncharacterized protein C6orf132 homolog [Arapaima gigas]